MLPIIKFRSSQSDYTGLSRGFFNWGSNRYSCVTHVCGIKIISVDVEMDLFLKEEGRNRSTGNKKKTSSKN